MYTPKNIIIATDAAISLVDQWSKNENDKYLNTINNNNKKKINFFLCLLLKLFACSCSIFRGALGRFIPKL